MTATTRNPNHPDAITVDELTPDRIVRFHYDGGTVDLRIVSSVFRSTQTGNRHIGVLNIRRGLNESRSLMGLGVEPYKDGSWNTDYVTAIP